MMKSECEMSRLSSEDDSRSIVLIDGVCLLCQGITKFIIKRDPEMRFYFASMQSVQGQELLKRGGISTQSLDSFVLIENGVYYTESTGALRVVRHLKAPWPWIYILRVIPRFIRDRVYRFVARNRYRWFGQSDQCMLPSPQDKGRFIDES
ncbi:putative DCC family thiol-disulfide oxidoreductase YuxK [Paenibacillus sp. DS2015]|uniref:thiol-disulfide oxidoreductase DCC family protein n=1 Tax=Paenibacillus sp. DS2015 TaxID=3373917 RepID=UPI003D1BF4F0